MGTRRGPLLAEHVEHIVRDRDLEAYLRTQAVVHRVARAVKAVVEPERTYVPSFGSQQGNGHLHWVRTVDNHPGRVYRKLGVASRAELAGRMLAPAERR